MTVLDEAIIFAVKAHEGQIRKGDAGMPYILHPVEVAGIIATMTQSLETMAAGVLHDTIEDCGVLPEEINSRFGARVAALVQSETEDRFAQRPPEETWLDRKRDSLLMLKYTKDREVKIMWLGDKLSNIRSFYREHEVNGDKMWTMFNQKDPLMQKWYYCTIAEFVKPELGDTAAYKEFCELIIKIWGDLNGTIDGIFE